MGVKTGRFRRSDRLLDSRDFRRVLRSGRRHADRDIVVIKTQRSVNMNEYNGLVYFMGIGSRLGIITSRKVGGAVIRNRFKRRIRAWFQLRRSEFEGDWDLVIIARPSGVSLSFDELEIKLANLLGLDRATSRAR